VLRGLPAVAGWPAGDRVEKRQVFDLPPMKVKGASTG